VNNRTVLVLAPHTDDGEFGCGGTISRLIEEGSRVIYAAFSAAEQSVLAHLPRDVLRYEVRAATSKLGISPADCVVMSFEVRRFEEQRQEILDTMIRLRRDLQPDLVFLPSSTDTHQDHTVIAREGFRAFKQVSMLGYEVLWNNLDFRTSCFFGLEERHVATKIASLGCYKSQEHRSYASEEFLRSHMLVRGTQIGRRYAEAFEVVRWVVS
jgi:LmbE family N-acetylglucosaminyl deacetylase